MERVRKFLVVYKVWKSDQHDRDGYPTGHSSDGNRIKIFDDREDMENWIEGAVAYSDTFKETEIVWKGDFKRSKDEEMKSRGEIERRRF